MSAPFGRPTRRGWVDILRLGQGPLAFHVFVWDDALTSGAVIAAFLTRPDALGYAIRYAAEHGLRLATREVFNLPGREFLQ